MATFVGVVCVLLLASIPVLAAMDYERRKTKKGCVTESGDECGWDEIK